MADDAKDRMISSAKYLLAREGYQGASFSAVIAHSGAPRGSIYYHFPGGKDQLVAAAVDATLQNGMSQLDRYRGKALTTVLRGIAEFWRGILERSDCEAGCPIVAASIGATDPELRGHVADVIGQWRTYYRLVLEDSGVSKRRSNELAALLLSGYQGAIHLARAERSLQAFDDTSRALRRAALDLAAA